MTEQRPVLAIGIDAAEISLIERWIDEGDLPNLGKLKQEGAYVAAVMILAIVSESTFSSLSARLARLFSISFNNSGTFSSPFLDSVLVGINFIDIDC